MQCEYRFAHSKPTEIPEARFAVTLYRKKKLAICSECKELIHSKYPRLKIESLAKAADLISRKNQDIVNVD